MIKISAVSYTNTLPFIYGLQHSDIYNDIELSLDFPAQCAAKLMNEQVDIGLIPTAAFLQAENLHLVSHFCIGANGPVNSVFIFSQFPIDEIEFLISDAESKTSNQLAMVLLKNYWKVNPIIIDADNSTSAKAKTAFVAIGDKTFGKKNDFKYSYDLAEAWFAFTKLPFVFAVWASNKIISPEFIVKLNNAFSFGLQHRDEIISKIIPSNQFDVSDYLYHKIDYHLDDDKRTAMKLFHRYISELNRNL